MIALFFILLMIFVPFFKKAWTPKDNEPDKRCICEMNADGEPTSGYCHKHKTEHL